MLTSEINCASAGGGMQPQETRRVGRMGNWMNPSAHEKSRRAPDGPCQTSSDNNKGSGQPAIAPRPSLHLDD